MRGTSEKGECGDKLATGLVPKALATTKGSKKLLICPQKSLFVFSSHKKPSPAAREVVAGDDEDARD